MLVENQTTNKLYTWKMTSGEEVIGKYLGDDNESITVGGPKLVRPMPIKDENGNDSMVCMLMPFMGSVEDSSLVAPEVKISKSHVSATGQPVKYIKDNYDALTTEPSQVLTADNQV